MTLNDDLILPPVHFQMIQPIPQQWMDHSLHNQFTMNNDLIIPFVPSLDGGESQDGESEQDPESESHNKVSGLLGFWYVDINFISL